MIEIAELRTVRELESVARDWDRLKDDEPRYFPAFSDIVGYLVSTGHPFRVMVARDGAEIVAIAAFEKKTSRKKYAVGERKLLLLPVAEVALIGSAILGRPDERLVGDFLNRIIDEGHFDLISLGEIIVGSPLHKAATRLGRGVVASRVGRSNSVRWLIKLPKTYDEYWKSIRSSATVARKIRKLEREHRCQFEVITLQDQIESFLRDGEKISRTTYQWNVGQRLCNDRATRDRFRYLAEHGQLRCYMLYVDGEPVAFQRGDLSGRIYNYETPGFDPEYRKLSPGMALFMWAIRDLIENTSCELFDFGTGGSDSDYKSQFGNFSIKCVSLDLGKWYRPYSLLLISLQEGLSFAKNAINFAFRNDWLRRRLKKAIRKYGDET